MKIWRWAVGGAVLVAGAIGVACSIHDDQTASSSGALNKWSTTPLFDAGSTVQVCFEGGQPQQWDWMRTAVENSWVSATNIHFGGWKACDMNDNNPVWVVVRLSEVYDDGGNPVGCGTTFGGGTEVPVAPASGDVSVSICYEPSLGRTYLEAVTNHEFGHVLGFEHEQDQDAGFTDPGFEAGYCAPVTVKDDAGNTVYDDGGNPIYDPSSFPDQDLTAYDPDSIMNYCHELREYSGRISDLDIQGVQSVYGVSTRTNGNGELDSDGDGWADYRDDCPYTKNDQTDSNFDAELTLARQDPNWVNDDGHRPLATDTQAYKDHWHDKYKGDACDPTVSTSVSTNNYASWLHTDCCKVRYVGGVTMSYLDCGQQCPITMYTGLTFQSYVGGPTGFSLTKYANSAPAFCPCDKMFGPQQSQCTDMGGTYQCLYAQDPLFPPLNGNPGTGNWRAIETEAHTGNFRWDAIHSDVYTQHVNIEAWAAPPTYASNWDVFYDDANSYGNVRPLLGLLWSHVNSAYPYSIINRPDPTNLENSYTPVSGDWQYGEIIHWVAPFGRKWWRIPYCNPLDSLQHTKYGQIAYGVSGVNSGDAYVVAQDETGVYEFTNALTANAIGLMNIVSNDAAEILVADDRVGGWPSDAVNPNAIVVSSGTTTLMGAFTTSGTRMDAQLASPPSQSSATLRSYAAGMGKLYSLELIPGTGSYRVYTRDVPSMLAGQTNTTYAAISGAAPSNPQAITWNAATSRLLVLDWLSSRQTASERLLAVDPTTGASTELWRTATFSGPTPSIALSTTLVGEVVLSQWGMGDNLVHVLVMQSDGRPESSTTIPGSAQSAVVANSSGLTVPLAQAVGDSTPNMGASYVDRSALSMGVCGSPWFRAIANGSVGSGSLLDGMTCPGAVLNGGFESGTFLSWTATGQSETISTNAHSGAYGAQLGATTPTSGDSTVQQSFVVPAGGGTLSFWYSNVCPDSVYYDWFTATLLGASGQLLATIVPRTCATSSAWTQATLDLAPWAGQSVTVVLTSHDDNWPGDPTYSFVDDVGVQ